MTGTEASRAATPSGRFLLLASLWSVGLFATLKLGVVEAAVVVPVLRFQQLVASWYGPPRVPIAVTLDCSGADVVALCLGAVLAYPVDWRRRLAGAAGGAAALLTLNVLRILSLGRVAGTPAFDTLHRFVWPTLLVAAAVAYVGLWMRWADARSAGGDRVRSPSAGFRMVPVAAVLLGAHLVLQPWLLTRPLVDAWARGAAALAAGALGWVGVPARAAGGVLTTSHGAFLVTPECVVTPLMPVYLAAALTLPRSWGRRGAALLAAPALFAGLTILRLLTVALPATLLGSPVVLTHAFYQFLVGGLVVAGAAWQAAPRDQPIGARIATGAGPIVVRAGLAVAGAALVTLLLAVPLTRVLGGAARRLGAAGAGPAVDEQGALAILPAFQLALLLALWLVRVGVSGPGRLGLATILLVASHLVLEGALGWLTLQAAAPPPVVALRAWAVAAPLLLVWALGPPPLPLGGPAVARARAA